MQGEKKILAQLPDGQVTAFTHVSADRKKICVPTTDARALEGYEKQTYNIDQRVQEENLNSYLRVYDTHTGEEVLTETVSSAWITHVQFSPVDSNMILYNHEWPSDCGIRRMWLWDGKNHIRLRTENEKRNRLDWTCHEMWERDGKGIIYHGSYNNGAPHVGKIFLEDMRIVEISFPPQYQKYGHFTVSNEGMLVSDGYFETEEEKDNVWPSYISVQKPNWEEETMEWIPLCKHDSAFDLQDSHPHPIYNHKGNAVYFTSSKDGKRAVYSCKV